MNIDEIQKEWDRCIISFGHIYVGASAQRLFDKIRDSQDIEGDMLGEKIESLKEMGVKRLPRYSGDPKAWWAMYKKMPINAWLARAVKGSFNKMHGKSDEEKLAFIRVSSFKRLKHKPSKRKKAPVDGVRLKINTRDRDKRTSWNTVK